jgi:hypothetical protein
MLMDSRLTQVSGSTIRSGSHMLSALATVCAADGHPGTLLERIDPLAAIFDAVDTYLDANPIRYHLSPGGDA